MEVWDELGWSCDAKSLEIEACNSLALLLPYGAKVRHPLPGFFRPVPRHFLLMNDPFYGRRIQCIRYTVLDRSQYNLAHLNVA